MIAFVTFMVLSPFKLIYVAVSSKFCNIILGLFMIFQTSYFLGNTIGLQIAARVLRNHSPQLNYLKALTEYTN